MDKHQAAERSRPGNDLIAAVPKFCLTLEDFRRSNEGRVRTSQEMLAHFFAHDDKSSKDEIFRHLPKDVRGPILSAWGIRGLKAALRDDDAKVESVVFDALLAGDIDHAAFESSLTPELVIRWTPLTSWWMFWRGGKLSKKAIGKALETAFDLGLFDARWFLDTIEGRGGQLKGTDVLSDGLTKADLTDWVKKIHQTGDGTPKGILLGLGWEKIVAQTANDTLIAVLDAFAQKSGLVSHSSSLSPAAMTDKDKAAAPEKSASPASTGHPIISSVARDKNSDAPRSRSSEAPRSRSSTSSPDVSASAKAEKEEKKRKIDAKAQTDENEHLSHTAESEAVNDDVVVVIDDDVPMPSLPPDEDEDNEATAVFSLRDEVHKK